MSRLGAQKQVFPVDFITSPNNRLDPNHVESYGDLGVDRLVAYRASTCRGAVATTARRLTNLPIAGRASATPKVGAPVDARGRATVEPITIEPASWSISVLSVASRAVRPIDVSQQGPVGPVAPLTLDLAVAALALAVVRSRRGSTRKAM